ncbi:nitroreductase family protein [Saccharicrinis aurantiacus]|uniref:nitroreductase family protein n=1 Tax=Saccharicrinis aurantiacus TaxID=1849719 RepID=UPI0008386405|nr:nitroreductase family protein [Saccharicrinis aurantiacus]
MHFKELMKTRYSVREYHENKVTRPLLKEVINAARLAPSAANKQPWKFVVIDEDKVLNDLRDAYDRDWFKVVPCVIAVFGDHSTGWKRSYDKKDHTDIDVAIAIDHMTLMATELGLGTCWICHFKADKIKRYLKVPHQWEPIALITIGYPVDIKPPEKKRKAIEEVMFYNEFK